jgi:hypothetical protein
MAGGGYGQNPARWGSVGRGWRRPRGSPRARFRWLEGAGRPRRAASVAPVGTGRRAASVGVRLVWARKWAARAAPRGLGKVEEGCLGSRSAWNRSSPRLLCLGTGGQHGRQLGGPARRGRASGRFIEELSDSGQGGTEGRQRGQEQVRVGQRGQE